MQIRAFRMQLRDGARNEYEQRHHQIWPELSDLLTHSGISNYRIFLDEESLALFAVMDVADEEAFALLPDHPVMRMWWHFMAPLMEVEEGSRPREWTLREIFHHA